MKHLRLFVAAIAVMLTMGANAWDGSAGKVYIQNVGSGLYWGAGNSWSTQASLMVHPEYVTLIADGSNFKMESQVSNGGTAYYFNGSFMDNASPVSLTFTKVGDYYNITSGEATYGYDGQSTVLGNAVDPRTENGQWRVFTEEELIATLASATESNPMDATFFILDPNFGRNNRNAKSWTPTLKKNGEDTNFNAEAYMTSFDFKQELTVPNGIYRLRAQAAVTYHDNRTIKAYDGGETPVIYIGDATLAYFEMEGDDKLSSQDAMSTAFSAGRYATDWSEPVNVTNGKLVVGTRSSRSDIWAVWDNFELQYLGPIVDLSIYIEAYQKALDEARELAATEETIGSNVLASLNESITVNGEDRVNQTSQEALENATASLNAAIAAAKTSIASYKIIEAGTVPTDNIAGWTCTNTQLFQLNTWSTEADNTGMVTPFIENWCERSGVLGDGMVYYTLEGLNPGEVYYAQALVRVYSESGNQPNGPIFFINDTETDMTTAGTAFTYDNKKGFYGTLGGVATVGSDGKLTLGVKISEANYNWVAFKNVSIQSMDAALQAAIDKVEAYYGQVTTAAANDAKALVESIKGNKPTTGEGYEEAIKSLNDKAEVLAQVAAALKDVAALGDFKSIYYEPVKALAEVAPYKELTSGAHAKLEAALNNFSMPSIDEARIDQMATADEIASFVSNFRKEAEDADNAIRDAGIEYNNNAEPTGDAVFNLTFMLTNPNLEGLPTWAPCDGWFTDRGRDIDNTANSQVMTNADATSEDGTKTAFYEYWSDAPAADDSFTLYQKVTLPAGIYNMSCYAFAQQPIGGDVRGVKFYANDTEGSTIATNRLAPASIEFVNTEAGEVKVGLKACAGNTYRWMGIGYVELYRLNGSKEIQLSDDDTAAPAAGAYTTINYSRKMLKGFNTLVLPFATSKTELAADRVLKYDGSEKVGDYVRLLFTETETISANTPYVVYVDADRALPVFENKTVTEPTDLTVKDDRYSFVGSYQAYAAGASPLVAGDYYMGVEGFKKSSGGNVHKAYRAYMKKEAEVTSDDEPIFCVNGIAIDGISEVAGAARQQSGQVYNLNGQKVSSAQKGIYIIDGKKVVVK